MLSACGFTTQTGSGKQWLASDPPLATNAAAGDIDAEVRAAAAVEPTLRFPARVGIARLDRRQLTNIPADEALAWEDAATHLGKDFGEFVPVSPIVAAMFETASLRGSNESAAREAIEIIRLAAARQHLDAVIVYEVDATSDVKANPLSLAEWTLIGAFVLPSEDVKAAGAAQAILLDVRNGYPYGTVQASSNDKTATARFSTRESEATLQDKVRADAVVKLAGETEAMLRKLRPELAALDVKPPRH
jgi:hypothetical protein